MGFRDRLKKILASITCSSRQTQATALAPGLILASSFSAEAIQISFDFSLDTNNFFASQERRNLLEQAADSFEFFTDNLTAITPGEIDSWTASLFNPSTGQVKSISNLLVPADTLIIFVGARDLGGNVLGESGPGWFRASGRRTWLDGVKNRGQGMTQGLAATDFAPWGGSIAFDVDTNWNFAASGPAAGKSDFYSVAVHELAHVFGIGTSDSWDACVVGGQFTCANAVESFGGNVPLNSSLGHWAEGIESTVNRLRESNGIRQQAAMNPTLLVGSRKMLTELDYAGLADVGWQVQAIPEPLTILGTATAFGFGAFFKRELGKKKQDKNGNDNS